MRVSAFDDPAAGAEHDDFVKVNDGLETVGDGDDGAVGEGGADDLLHQRVRVDVDTTRTLLASGDLGTSM